jgi:hypothetical protein
MSLSLGKASFASRTSRAALREPLKLTISMTWRSAGGPT